MQINYKFCIYSPIFKCRLKQYSYDIYYAKYRKQKTCICPMIQSWPSEYEYGNGISDNSNWDINQE